MITVAVSDTFFKPLVNLPAGTIYWRVKGDSTTSATSSFIITDVRIPLLIPYEPKIAEIRRPLPSVASGNRRFRVYNCRG